MRVIVYARKLDTLEAVRRAVVETMPDVRIEGFETVGSLGEELRKSTYNCTVVVIVASGKDELKEVSAFQELLWGLRTIVVLPDGDDDETVSLAHGLRPRFVSSYGDGLRNVVAVLNKMLEDHNSKSIVG